MLLGVEEIRRLSQEEGMFDNEIADYLGIHRVTVNRIRKQYSIPRANLKNRKDKPSYCTKCGKPIIIKRRERFSSCQECQS